MYYLIQICHMKHKSFHAIMFAMMQSYIIFSMIEPFLYYAIYENILNFVAGYNAAGRAGATSYCEQKVT